MKRKLFSAILFGALLTASTSGLTSCKDYDDDISNLQSQIDKLATVEQLQSKASELQAAISAAQSAAESKAAAAETVAKAAQSAADAAATAASKAQSTADGASQAAKDAAAAAAAANEVGKAAQAAVDKLAAEAATKAELEAAAAAAKTYVDSVKDAIEAAHAADKATIEKAIADGLDEVKAEIAKTNEALAALDARVKAAEDKLAAIEAGEGQEELIKAIAEELEAIENGLEYLGISVSEMITAIHLYNKFGFGNDLNFYQVKEAVDRTFPYGDEVKDVTNETVEFKSGTVRALEDSILVRVSPASAVLHAEDLSLINTQGQEFDASLFESIEVKEFNREAPMTRAEGNNNTGLWVVKFKLVKDFDADKFAAETAIKDKGQILFALAAANCDINLSEDRRVATEFDVTVAAPKAKHATTFDLKPATAEAWTPVTKVHHRFTAYTNPLAGTFPESLKKDDWKWKSGLNSDDDIKAGKANLVFDKKAEGDAQNAEKEDDRQSLKVLAVSEGERIDIDFKQPIKAFYVTVDWKRAGESGKSEINAWNTYSYTNVGKVDDTGKVITAAPIQYGQKGFISVDELKQYASQGDVIGFRVWAINLDGSMVDPDGTAFYVGIGQNADISEKTVSGSALVSVKNPSATENSAVIDVEDAFGIDFNSITFVQETYNMDGNSTDQKKEGYQPTVADSLDYDDEDIMLSYLDKNGKSLNPKGNYTSVKYIRAKIKNPKKLVDNKTYNVKATLKATVGGTTAIVRYVNIAIKKEMPTGLPSKYELGFRMLQGEEQAAIPQADKQMGLKYEKGYWTSWGEWKAGESDDIHLASNKIHTGSLNLDEIFWFKNTKKNLKDVNEISFAIEKAAVGTEDDGADDLKVADVTNAVLGGQFVNGSKYKVKGTYTYADISHRFDKFHKEKTSRWDNASATPSASLTAAMIASEDDLCFSGYAPEIKVMPWSTVSTDYVTYSWDKKRIQAKNETNKKDEIFIDNNEVQWLGKNRSISIYLGHVNLNYGNKLRNMTSKVTANDDLAKALTVTGGKASLIFNKKTNTNSYDIADFNIWMEMEDGTVSDYFKASAETTEGYIELTQLRSNAAEHTEYICFELVDCFDHHEIVKLPIRIVDQIKQAVNEAGSTTLSSNPITDQGTSEYVKRK